MPTAARKQREAEKRRQVEQDTEELAEFDRLIEQLSPTQLGAMRVCFDGNKDLICELPAYLRMKGGLIQFDENGEIWISGNLGRGGNLSRENDALDSANDLKRKYSDIWGNRGYAKLIAYETGLSVETIRRYCKKLP